MPIDFYLGATSEIIDHASCAMMVSGSVSLELMARQTPAAVVYRVGRFLYAFGKCVVKVDSMTLPNLMPESADGDGNGERVFPEIVSVGHPRRAKDFLVGAVGRMRGIGGWGRRSGERLICFPRTGGNLLRGNFGNPARGRIGLRGSSRSWRD